MTRSTVATNETIKWKDGKEYPVYKIEISAESHPFYTGKQKIVDTAGRVDKFKKRYARKGAGEGGRVIRPFERERQPPGCLFVSMTRDGH